MDALANSATLLLMFDSRLYEKELLQMHYISKQMVWWLCMESLSLIAG
jgi:hypothetical protein